MPQSRTYIPVGIALVLSLILMGLPTAWKQTVAQHTMSGFWTGGQWLFSRVIRYAKNEHKTRFLLAQNVRLALENMQLREAGEENRRLREALAFRERKEMGKAIPAEVIARDPDQMYNTLVINAGEDSGILVDWSVITTDGLVGHIVQVEKKSSRVQLIGTRFRVSAVVQPGRAHGVVAGVLGGAFELLYVDASSDVGVGDRVVSSGLGGRYPKGITIGYVTQVGEQPRDPLFKEVFLESKVHFRNLEEVFVMRPTGT